MYGTTITATSWETNGYHSPASKNTSGHYDHQKSVFEGESGSKSFWSSIMDHLNDDVAQKELSDWLETTDVFEEEKECSPAPPEAAAAAAQGQQRHELKRESSFELVDGEMFGIDAQTALRAAQIGMASSDNVTATYDLWAPLSSSSSSEKPKPQSSTTQGSHQQQVIDLTITEPAIDLTAEDALYQPPSRTPASASLNVRNQDRNDSQVNSQKRPRMLFEESKKRSSSLDDPTLFSSIATMGAQKQPRQERRQSCPSSRRSSPESINSWQKISIKDPQQAYLSETMPAKTDQQSSSSTSFFRGRTEDSSRRPNFINNWQKKSLQDPQQSSLPQSKPPVTGQDSTSTSFFDGGSGTNEDSSRRNSLDFINYVQQHSQNTNPRRTSLSNSMPPATGQSSVSTTFSFHGMNEDSSRSSGLDFINQVQQQSQYNPRRTSLSASMPPVTAQGPSSSTSFFRNMDEQSSHVYRMMDAMAQTRQSRQMVSSFLDNGTNSFNNMNVAASANSTNSFNMNVATSAATASTAAAQPPEVGMQYRAAGINDARAAANNVEMTPEWVEAKRNLDQIAREQKELDEKIAELLKRGGRLP